MPTLIASTSAAVSLYWLLVYPPWLLQPLLLFYYINCWSQLLQPLQLFLCIDRCLDRFNLCCSIISTAGVPISIALTAAAPLYRSLVCLPRLLGLLLCPVTSTADEPNLCCFHHHGPLHYRCCPSLLSIASIAATSWTSFITLIVAVLNSIVSIQLHCMLLSAPFCFPVSLTFILALLNCLVVFELLSQSHGSLISGEVSSVYNLSTARM